MAPAIGLGPSTPLTTLQRRLPPCTELLPIPLIGMSCLPSTFGQTNSGSPPSTEQSSGGKHFPSFDFTNAPGSSSWRTEARTFVSRCAGVSDNSRAATSLRFRLCANSTQLDADMELLFKLHEARWAGGYSRAFTGHRQAFHLEFAHIALARRWLRLWVMELDSVPVAVWYGFRYAGVEWYYQAGRNPAYDSASVGFVLLCHTIRAALQDGASAYWFLRGSETYKGRFAEEDPGVETIAAARTARGRAAITIARHIDRAPVAARHYVRSRFG